MSRTVTNSEGASPIRRPPSSYWQLIEKLKSPSRNKLGFMSLALFFLFLTELALIIYAASYGHALYRRIMELAGITSIGMHFAAFALLTITTLLIWKRYWSPMSALVLIAIGLEVAQIFLPNREAHVIDAAASIAGVLIGWMTIVGLKPFVREQGR